MSFHHYFETETTHYPNEDIPAKQLSPDECHAKYLYKCICANGQTKGHQHFKVECFSLGSVSQFSVKILQNFCWET